MNLDKPLASPLSRRQSIASATALIVSPSVFALPGFTRTTSSSGTDAMVVAAASVPRQVSDDERVRPFTVRVLEAQLVDLRRRIAATKWPRKNW